jgi:hypothetical protein
MYVCMYVCMYVYIYVRSTFENWLNLTSYKYYRYIAYAIEIFVHVILA